MTDDPGQPTLLATILVSDRQTLPVDEDGLVDLGTIDNTAAKIGRSMKKCEIISAKLRWLIGLYGRAARESDC